MRLAVSGNQVRRSGRRWSAWIGSGWPLCAPRPSIGSQQEPARLSEGGALEVRRYLGPGRLQREVGERLPGGSGSRKTTCF